MRRDEAIRSLVRFDRPLEVVREVLADFPFDWDGPPLGTIRREHVLAVLARWQTGELSAQDVEEWANLVEVRDDLDHDPSDPNVADAIFDLANPVLNGQLAEVAATLLETLKA